MPNFNSQPNVFITFVIIIVIAGLTSYYADRKGRNAMAWFVLGLLLGAIAPLILLFLPSLNGKDKELDSNQRGPSSMPTSFPFDSKETHELPVIRPIFPEENKLWYYLDQNHNQYGPVSIIALKDLWKTGQLELNSYVWSEGMQNWEKVDNLPQLKEAFKHYQG